MTVMIKRNKHEVSMYFSKYFCLLCTSNISKCEFLQLLLHLLHICEHGINERWTSNTMLFFLWWVSAFPPNLFKNTI